MVRWVGLAVLIAMTVAAAPQGNDFSQFTYLDKPTVGSPVRVTPPPARPGAFAPAPVPDIDALAPVVIDPGPKQPELQANLFTPQKGYRGEGYTYGSSVQASQTRNVRPAPGFSLKVPLE